MTKASECLAFSAALPPAGRHQTERDQPPGRWMGEGVRAGEEGEEGRGHLRMLSGAQKESFIHLNDEAALK